MDTPPQPLGNLASVRVVRSEIKRPPEDDALKDSNQKAKERTAFYWLIAAAVHFVISLVGFTLLTILLQIASHSSAWVGPMFLLPLGLTAMIGIFFCVLSLFATSRSKSANPSFMHQFHFKFAVFVSVVSLGFLFYPLRVCLLF